ncbi:hypothetical protein HPC37_01205 [Pasteurellaceae bacterium 20609_3]|uniref:surface-adhesin E family protein n=1 Tax=Spirabiliibacterium mucosae TaxID=28156 RepID=UPI001AAC5934|nr:surface-adhesin E family protein [Spirabiliibacterium mucosae]MBE2897496.1 hypothetical protein [Spirabiliibacterium mucosae]
MKKFALFGLCCLALPAWAGNWHYVADTVTRDKIYINMERSKVLTDRVWVKVNFRKPRNDLGDQKGITHLLMEYQYSCEKWTIANRQTLIYGKHNKKIGQENNKKPQAQPVPDTAKDGILKTICRK